MPIDHRRETENRPAMEMHVGEVHEVTDGDRRWGRFVIIWINGKRWQGTLTDRTDLDFPRQSLPTRHRAGK